MKTKSKYKKIKDIKQLKAILTKHGTDDGYMDFFISFGLFRSSKEMMYEKETGLFLINNCIDDTEQDLTEKQLSNKKYTNIGEAIKKGAFYQVI